MIGRYRVFQVLFFIFILLAGGRCSGQYEIFSASYNLLNTVAGGFSLSFISGSEWLYKKKIVL